jgi:hypothetical protein
MEARKTQSLNPRHNETFLPSTNGLGHICHKTAGNLLAKAAWN